MRVLLDPEAGLSLLRLEAADRTALPGTHLRVPSSPESDQEEGGYTPLQPTAGVEAWLLPSQAGVMCGSLYSLPGNPVLETGLPLLPAAPATAPSSPNAGLMGTELAAKRLRAARTQPQARMRRHRAPGEYASRSSPAWVRALGCFGSRVPSAT